MEPEEIKYHTDGFSRMIDFISEDLLTLSDEEILWEFSDRVQLQQIADQVRKEYEFVATTTEIQNEVKFDNRIRPEPVSYSVDAKMFDTENVIGKIHDKNVGVSILIISFFAFICPIVFMKAFHNQDAAAIMAHVKVFIAAVARPNNNDDTIIHPAYYVDVFFNIVSSVGIGIIVFNNAVELLGAIMERRISLICASVIAGTTFSVIVNLLTIISSR